MAHESSKILSCMIMLAFLSPLAMVWAQGESGVTASPGKANPHHGDGGCGACHVASEAELKSFFTSDGKKRSLRADLVAVCRQCHGVGFGHGVGKKPELNRASLPLAADGTITCAVTCHDMHLPDVSDRHQNRYHLRLPIERLCVSCHNK